MPQLGSGGGDDLGATDEMLAFKDEGEQEEKIPENAFTERDLADLKSSLVNESEGSGSPAAAAADAEVSQARAAPHGGPAPPAPRGPRPTPPLPLSLLPCRPSGECRIRRGCTRRSSRTTWMMVSRSNLRVSLCVPLSSFPVPAGLAQRAPSGAWRPGSPARHPDSPGSEGCQPGHHSPQRESYS